MLPDLSVIFVVFAVVLLAVVLDRVLFKPLLRVMRERARPSSRPSQLAENATAKAQAATAEFDAQGDGRPHGPLQADGRAPEGRRRLSRRPDGARPRPTWTRSSPTPSRRSRPRRRRPGPRSTADAEALGQDIAAKVLGRDQGCEEHVHRALRPLSMVVAHRTHGLPLAMMPAEERRRRRARQPGLLEMIAKLFNFALLAGTLVYFLRSPLATYLSDRGTQIRSDLVKAADMKQSAAAQLADDRREDGRAAGRTRRAAQDRRRGSGRRGSAHAPGRRSRARAPDRAVDARDRLAAQDRRARPASATPADWRWTWPRSA